MSDLVYSRLLIPFSDIIEYDEISTLALILELRSLN